MKTRRRSPPKKPSAFYFVWTSWRISQRNQILAVMRGVVSLMQMFTGGSDPRGSTVCKATGLCLVTCDEFSICLCWQRLPYSTMLFLFSPLVMKRKSNTIFHHLPAGIFRTWCLFNFNDEVVNAETVMSKGSEILHRAAVGLSSCWVWSRQPLHLSWTASCSVISSIPSCVPWSEAHQGMPVLIGI